MTTVHFGARTFVFHLKAKTLSDAELQAMKAGIPESKTHFFYHGNGQTNTLVVSTDFQLHETAQDLRVASSVAQKLGPEFEAALSRRIMEKQGLDDNYGKSHGLTILI